MNSETSRSIEPNFPELEAMQEMSAKPSAPCTNLESPSRIAQETKSFRENIPQGRLSDEVRLGTIRALMEVVRTLEKPEDVVMRQAFETHTHNFCLRMGIDLRIFHVLKERSEVSPVSANELAEIVGADAQFIIRIMRVITSIGYAKEAGERLYASTPLTLAITIPALEACMIHSFDHTARVCLNMPEYFRTNGYKSPTDAASGPFQSALNTELKFFDYLHQDPRKVKNFNTFMSGNRTGRRHWVEWFPIRKSLLGDFLDNHEGIDVNTNDVTTNGTNGDTCTNGSISTKTSDKVFLVDMGGGQGHDLERLLEDIPETAGHLVLQDLPGTVEGLKDFKGKIKPMVHDIFTPQKVASAKVYYTHFVLHDFSDDACRIILSHVVKVMTPGYSRLILNETVLPDMGCPSFFASADITMMANLAALKRSRKQWSELLESAGLKVVKFWDSPDTKDFEAVIEAVVE